MQDIESAVAQIDRKITSKWRNEPDGNVSVSFLYDAPADGWQFIGGVLARIDVSALPVRDGTLMQQRLARYLNAPFTNALMQEISKAHRDIGGNWGMMWQLGDPERVTLTIWPHPPGMNAQTDSQSPQHNFPADGEKQIRVGGGVQATKLRVALPPAYPPLALQARIQGVVRFNVQVDKDGRVKRVQLISGHPLLVESAKDALARYEYEPTLLNGEPVQVVTVADVNFNLNQ